MLESTPTRPELRGTFGMVSSTHWIASAVGMRALERGGNAFDAAVAAALVLQVIEPHMNGPAGDLSLLFWSEELGEARVLCGQGVAPRAATIRAFGDLGLNAVPGTGLLAACVPGAFDAWMLLLRDFGRLGVRDAFEPAIHYAGGGFPAAPLMCQRIAEMEATFRELWPSSRDHYLATGVPAPHSQFRNRPLAQTFTRIVRDAESAGPSREAQVDAARDAFYRGSIAEIIVGFSSGTSVVDSSGSGHSGLLSLDDLASWRASYERPVTGDYRGMTVCKTGPWGQGPVFLQQLALLDGFALNELPLDSADRIHTIVECAKLAFADREAWYGDPDHVDVPLEALLSSDYNAARRPLVGDRASLELIPGSPDGRSPSIAVPGRETPAPGTREPTLTTGDTCYVAVVDRDGNVVSATPSGGWLQSSPVMPSLGFPLGTRAQMFSLVEGAANALVPGARPRTTLSPTLVLRDGRPVLAFGTPGGDQQDQWTVGFFLAHIDCGLDLQAAIDLPAFHTTHFPDSFYPHEARPGEIHVEARVGESVISELRSRGHTVEVEPAWGLGRLGAVGRDESGVLSAGANPRGKSGYAVGR